MQCLHVSRWRGPCGAAARAANVQKAAVPPQLLAVAAHPLLRHRPGHRLPGRPRHAARAAAAADGRRPAALVCARVSQGAGAGLNLNPAGGRRRWRVLSSCAHEGMGDFHSAAQVWPFPSLSNLRRRWRLGKSDSSWALNRQGGAAAPAGPVLHAEHGRACMLPLPAGSAPLCHAGMEGAGLAACSALDCGAADQGITSFHPLPARWTRLRWPWAPCCWTNWWRAGGPWVDLPLAPTCCKSDSTFPAWSGGRAPLVRAHGCTRRSRQVARRAAHAHTPAPCSVCPLLPPAPQPPSGHSLTGVDQSLVALGSEVQVRRAPVVVRVHPMHLPCTAGA